MTSSREQAEMDRLAERRQNFERSLTDARQALSRELGVLAPRRAIWAIPLVAFACAFAIAQASGRLKRRKSETTDTA